MIDIAPTGSNVFVERARPGDLPSLLALLAASSLPMEGVGDHLDTALVIRAGDRIVGCAIVEPYAREGLLRSVAVEGSSRGRGLGRSLVSSACQLAGELGCERLFLLTTTAVEYFPRLGFRPVDRSEVPEAIRSSPEFAAICPESAAALALELTAHREDRKHRNS